MAESIAEKEARLDRGESFAALRKAGKISLSLPTTGEVNGPARMSGKYPYFAKGLKGLKGAETLPQGMITKAGITMSCPVITDAKSEREFAAKFGYQRD